MFADHSTMRRDLIDENSSIHNPPGCSVVRTSVTSASSHNSAVSNTRPDIHRLGVWTVYAAARLLNPRQRRRQRRRSTGMDSSMDVMVDLNESHHVLPLSALCP